MTPIKELIVFGNINTIPEDSETGEEAHIEYQLIGATRDNSNKHPVDLKSNDKLLEFVLEDGTTWMCDASTLHEVYPELDPALHPENKRSSDTESFTLPTTVDAPTTERGIVGKIAIKILRVFFKKAVEKGAEVVISKIAMRLENAHMFHGIVDDKLLKIDKPAKGKKPRKEGIFNEDGTIKNTTHFPKKNNPLYPVMINEDGTIKDAALFSIDKAFNFHPFTDKTASNRPYFLFIHGTNSDTRGAFWDLKNSSVWSTLHERYANKVIGFQHRSLTQSPLQNAVALANMLPDGSELHLITHSRGGIIGDILNKYSNNGKGFSEHHIALLEKEGERTKDIHAIRELNTIFKKKGLTITKYIRVACPAAGTKLASKRLDHILNVFFNLFGGVFGTILKELLSTAVNTKDNVEVLPGLEAMNPESPFVKILNDPSDENEIDGAPLAVISGNGRVNFSGKGLLVILGKLFYWQRNDLVVNTDSMYLGAKRSGTIQYFFDQGVAVDHVTYFENIKTREAIDLVLKTESGNVIPGFKKVAQYSVPAGDRALIEHGALRDEHPISGNRPIVVLLPGIMGSNLSQSNREVWLHYRRILKGGLMNLKYPNVDDIIADSVVKTSYYKLYKWLLGKYDVVVYPFDWRIPLEESAKDLNSKIESLLKYEQPIKLIGHSMGGVLVRDFIINHNETWQRLNTSKDFRLLFLGSPLSGSHRILTVLFGQDAIIKKLSALDLFNTKKSLLQMFSKFPGILDLLPIIDPKKDPKNDFGQLKVWKDMRAAYGEPDWPLPGEEDLERFRIYRDKILKERDHIDYTNMVYIAGKDKMTAYGYHLDTIPPKKELYFLYTSEGDQSVTWELGIPKKMIEKEAVYYTRVSHGALANDSSIFGGIDEILMKGRTNLLRSSKPLLRGEEKIFRAEPDIDFDLSEDGLTETVLGLGHETESIGSQIPITVSISNGDLRYASYPIIAGHFLNDGVLYAEKDIDSYLNGSLRSKHALGIYPGEIGSNAIFDKVEDSDFPGALIIGMGEPDQLTTFQLAKSVELAVLNYLLDLRGKKVPKNGIGISSLVMASEYGGLSIESSMEGVISGVDRANAKIKTLTSGGFGTVQRIEFIELYAYKSLNCMYVLNQIANRENAALNIILESKKIKRLLGIRKRIPLDLSDDWWNRITVRQGRFDEKAQQLESMIFGASTNDSREEENEIYSSTPLINQFISEVSTDNQWSPHTAKTLFELLIPNALKEKLKRKGNISWVLDTKTASYPWELLQDSTANAKPLCVSSGMIRQLTTGQYRQAIKRMAEHKVLVVADPILEGYIGQLPGAREEGELVKDLLEDSGYLVKPLIGAAASAATIIKELFCNDYSIVHLAGHGVFNPDSPKESGVVIGNKLFLSVFEIQQLPIVPELVFVNCCHLGHSSYADEQLYENRYKLAANIGTQLIQIGVKAVVAAGWAVDDRAALEFANVFYARMLSGYTFGESVKMARANVYEKYPGTNTWGAYQCYGDPFFKLKNTASGPWAPSYIVPEEAEIHLENLLNQLQMGTTTRQDALDELATIMKAVAEHDDFQTGPILEREAKIYNELAMYKEAVEKFEQLFCIEEAHFSFSCMETYCNTRIKWHVKEIFEKTNSSNTREKARKNIEAIIEDLEKLKNTGKTAERLNLLGSAHRRLSMLAEKEEDRLAAYKASMENYKSAYEHSVGAKKIYSLTNAAKIAFLMHCCGKENSPAHIIIKEDNQEVTYDIQSIKATATIKSVKELLEKHKSDLKKDKDMDTVSYWDLSTHLDIDLCLLLLEEDEIAEEKWNALADQFYIIWKKAGSEAKKIAELEHLQFLIHALNALAGINDSFSPVGTSASKDKLEVYMIELRRAFAAAQQKIKDKKSSTSKKK